MNSAGIFEDTLTAALGAWELEITLLQLAQMRGHFEAVVLANQTMNLTRITDPAEAAIKHYADSLAVLLWERAFPLAGGLSGRETQTSLLDVGTGAGFPAVPLAIMKPRWNILALDGTRKKAEFLGKFAREAGLMNLRAEHGHSDHWKTDQQFDWVTTRAVASLGQVMRTCRRFVRKAGWIIAYKTAKLADEERQDARRTADELAMVIEEPFPYELRCGATMLERALYRVRIA